MVQLTEVQKDIKGRLSLIVSTMDKNKYNVFYRHVEALLQFQRMHNVEILNPVAAISNDTLYIVFKSWRQCRRIYNFAAAIYKWVCNPTDNVNFEFLIHTQAQIVNNADMRDQYIDNIYIRFNYLIVTSFILQTIKPLIRCMFEKLYRVRLHLIIIDFVRELAGIQPLLFKRLGFDTNNFEFDVLPLSKLLTNVDDEVIIHLYNVLLQFYIINNDEPDCSIADKYTHFTFNYNIGINEDYCHDNECYIECSDISNEDEADDFLWGFHDV